MSQNTIASTLHPDYMSAKDRKKYRVCPVHQIICLEDPQRLRKLRENDIGRLLTSKEVAELETADQATLRGDN